MSESAKATPTRQAAMLDSVNRHAERTGGKRHPSDYPSPYPYWLRGKVARIRR